MSFGCRSIGRSTRRSRIREERRAAESIEEARLLGEDHGVVVRGDTVRARAIGEAIVNEAIARDVDLIVLGSAPKWRRQSRFFSPTVEYVLRQGSVRGARGRVSGERAWPRTVVRKPVLAACALR